MLHSTFSSLSGVRLLRRMVLPVFARFNPGDVHIRHHYTGQRMRLHSFRHKGYWFHGRRREHNTMQFFEQVLQPGDSVVEVGGHIGYLTMLFAKLVSESGKVVVFEPGRNNLPYLRANVGGLRQVQIAEMAVSNVDGSAPFFEEELTGQNNSLLGDYERFAKNRESANSRHSYHERSVATVRLDTFLREEGLQPDLIKIDIEGAESLALAGAAKVLAEFKPLVMVEVTRDAAEVYALLHELNYMLVSPDGRPLRAASELQDNVCAFHREKHRRQLQFFGRNHALVAA